MKMVRTMIVIVCCVARLVAAVWHYAAAICEPFFDLITLFLHSDNEGMGHLSHQNQTKANRERKKGDNGTK